MSFLSSLLGGGGGGSSSTSTSTSWTQTIQQDQRVTAEGAELVAGAGAVVSLPGSVAVAPGASVRDVVIQEYTPEVQQTVGELIESVNIISQETIPILVESFGEAMAKTAETSMMVTQVLGEKLQETELGQAAILPGMAKYLAIAVVVIIIARKVLR